MTISFNALLDVWSKLELEKAGPNPSNCQSYRAKPRLFLFGLILNASLGTGARAAA